MGNLVGRSLAHFRIEAELGEGGMGVVYLATDDKLGRAVALKVLPQHFAENPERRQRFMREARSAAAVTHANIATVYEIGEADGQVFIAMELVKGRSLRERLADPLPAPEALHIATSIAVGLAAAHESGIVHRDLKPENVMVTAKRDVKILDFGLAKHHEAHSPSVLGEAKTEQQITEDGRVLGTPAYMSPEQARGETVDARSDVFSFGVMLYEMLSGVRPFQGSTAIAVLLAVTTTEPEPISRLNSSVPPEVERIVARCLEKLPGARYANGQELLDGLSALAEPSMPSTSGRLASASLPTESPVAPPASAGWTPRRDLKRAALLLPLTIVGVLAVFAWGLGWRPSRSATVAPEVATSSSSMGGVAITDLPIPATTVPDARTEYVAGVQAMRDDNFTNARNHFEHAAALDPSLAAAHLRLAMARSSIESAETKRAEFAQAVALRARLTEHDQALMEALEPMLGRAQEDRSEAIRRLEAATDQYPSDVELLDWLSMLDIAERSKGLEAAERATELDPKDALAWEDLGRHRAIRGKLESARQAFERCAAVSIESADCVDFLAALDVADGQCAAFEKKALKAADEKHNSGGALFRVAEAMFSVGKGDAAVRETIAQAVARVSEGRRTREEARFEAMLAIVDGHFDAARIQIDRYARALAEDSRAKIELTENLRIAELRVGVLIETGDDAGAKRAAQGFTVRRETWTSHEMMDFSGGETWRLKRLAAGRPEAIDGERAAWIEESLRQGEPPGLVWTDAWAATAFTPEEGRRAVEALDHDARLAQPLAGQEILRGQPLGASGHALLLAGRPGEAIPSLRRAAANCHVLEKPFDHVQALVDLGEALEQTGDPSGACAAYYEVLSMWGQANPRSVSALKAKARRQALACEHSASPRR